MAIEKIKLGVLWKNLTKEGQKPYLSGRVQEDSLDAAVDLLRKGGRFLVFSNKKRPDKQDPDYVLLVVPEPERQRDEPPRQPSGGTRWNDRGRPGSSPAQRARS